MRACRRISFTEWHAAGRRVFVGVGLGLMPDQVWEGLPPIQTKRYVAIIGGGPPKPKRWAIPFTTTDKTVWMTLGGTALVKKVLIKPP